MAELDVLRAEHPTKKHKRECIREESKNVSSRARPISVPDDAKWVLRDPPVKPAAPPAPSPRSRVSPVPPRETKGETNEDDEDEPSIDDEAATEEITDSFLPQSPPDSPTCGPLVGPHAACDLNIDSLIAQLDSEAVHKALKSMYLKKQQQLQLAAHKC